MSQFQDPKPQHTSPSEALATPPIAQSMAPDIEVWMPYVKPYDAVAAAEMLARGKPRAIGLGEGTHRAQEMFQAQADITKALIEKHHCTLVMVEADGSDMTTVSSAIRSGDSNRIKTALKDLSFPTVSNSGFLSLCEWLKGQSGVKLSGLDVQTKGAAEVLREESEKLHLPDALGPELLQLSKDFEDAKASALAFRKEQESIKVKGYPESGEEQVAPSQDNPQRHAADQVDVTPIQEKVKDQGLKLLEKVGGISSHLKIDLDKVKSALRSISGLCGLYEIECRGEDPIPHRDELMAKTAFLDLAGAGLGVVLAHNGHVTFAPTANLSKETFYTDSGAKALGAYLKERYSAGYRVLQQIAGGGTLGRLTTDEGRNIDYTYPPPQQNDIEHYLAQVSQKLGGSILFDVESALKDDGLGPYLTQHIFNINSMGTNTPPSSTFRVRLPEIGDVILFHPGIHPEQFL